jgi:uncharacterized protein YndB with AHSA1/START domain/uncharacterized protein YciI
VTVAPIRREILVPAAPAVAFELFTGQILAWWPVADHSVFGASATVAFEDGARIVERGPGGERATWGEVIDWKPPDELRFTWHPGGGPATTVTVSFSRHGEQTLVVLRHDGWEALADPAGARDEYDHGWPNVLGRFAAHVGETEAAPDPRADTWVALLHRPGAGTPTDESLFGCPQFAEHVAFLERMREHGYLVAAGPLSDEPGAGMTVLRLPGAGRLPDATRLAIEDDASVASGFFAVTVRPWQVMF